MVGRSLNKKVRRLNTDSEGDDDIYDSTVLSMKAQSKAATRNNNHGLDESEIVEEKRNRRVKKSYTLEDESDDDSEIPYPGDNGDIEDAEDDENSDTEADFDENQYHQKPVPKQKSIKGKLPAVTKLISKSGNSATQKQKKSRQDVSDNDDDDELSDLESDLGDEDKEITQIGEGEENELMDDEDNEDLGSDDEPADRMEISTPGLNNLTRRQRARFEEGHCGHLMALPDEVQVKKHLTAEEHAMRRAEMARRRKNLSEKRNEEEKLETINKLLKKQAPKTNTRRRELNVATGGDGTPDVTETLKPNPMFVRWVSNKEGNRIGVPTEWLDSPVGEIFKNVS